MDWGSQGDRDDMNKDEKQNDRQMSRWKGWTYAQLNQIIIWRE